MSPPVCTAGVTHLWMISYEQSILPGLLSTKIRWYGNYKLVVTGSVYAAETILNAMEPIFFFFYCSIHFYY